MNARCSLLLAAGVTLLLAGCGDSKDGTSTVEPSTQSLVGVSGAPSCSNQVVNTIRASARDLFGPTSAEASLAGTIDRTDQPGNVPIGFSLFRSIATLRDGSATWSSTQAGLAATLTVNLIWCMDVAVTAPVADITVANLTSALGSQGLYAIRGGAGDAETAAIARDGQSGIAPFAPTTFASHLGGQALIYGREIAFNGLAPSAGRRYDISLVRSSKAALTGTTARQLCTLFEDIGNRLEHKSGTQNTILPDVPAIFTCPPEPVAAARGVLEHIKNFLLPQPAYARRGTGSTKGTAGGYSPHWAVDPGAVTLTFVQQPKNGTTNTSQTPPIRVKATGNNADPNKPGVAWEAVDIRLDAFNNNGNWVCSSGNVAQTDATGTATFPNFSINKPGGYKLVATTVTSADDDGTQNGNYTDSESSNRFNLQQGTLPSSPSDPCQ